MSRTALARKDRSAGFAMAKATSRAASGALRIGRPDDSFEREADRAATDAMSGGKAKPEWLIAKMRIYAPVRGEEAGAFPIVDDALSSPGEALDAATRHFFEPRFGHDFENVRIHSDSKAAASARAVKAAAYTVGRDVVFGAGRYQPYFASGRHLLAHELTHVVQQSGGQQEPSGIGVMQRQPIAVSGSPVPMAGPYTGNQPFPTPAPAPAPVPPGNTPAPTPAANVDVRDWVIKLPHAVRGPHEQITKVKDKIELSNTKAGVSAPLTAEQQAIVDQVKKNREQVPDSPAVTERSSFGRGDGDKKGGFQYGGRGGRKFRPDNPYKDAPSRQVWDAIFEEIGNEGSVSAVNTYDDALVTLGSGFTGPLVSRVMEDFLSKDQDAKNAFLNIGVLFSGGKLMVVNTDSGAIEEDEFGPKGKSRNAREILSLSKPILSRFVSLAETEEHAKVLVDAQQKQTFGFKFTKHVVDTWKDMLAVRLVAHCIHWRSSAMWAQYENCDDNVKKIITVLAPRINGGKRNAALGNAFVASADQTTALFMMAKGKAKEALDSPTSEEPISTLAPDSERDVLRLQDPAAPKKYFKATLA